jgi:hypothetical protein
VSCDLLREALDEASAARREDNMLNLAPSHAQWFTLAFVIVVTVLVIGYDLAAIRSWGFEASISRVVRRLFGISPTLFVAIVFWLGILVGHIWLPTE